MPKDVNPILPLRWEFFLQIISLVDDTIPKIIANKFNKIFKQRKSHRHLFKQYRQAAVPAEFVLDFNP